MSDMVFNELSIEPLARDKTEGFKRVTKFIETLVYCVSTPNHFQNAAIEQWLESLRKIELVKCPLSAHEKQISLRDDHGKDILLQFSKKIVQSPYVIRIINSLPFNPAERKFIKHIRANGIIEIVLTDTDRGLGLVVKTTGRNARETKRIAEILQEKYY